MRIHPSLVIMAVVSIGLAASVDFAGAEKKKKRTIGGAGCTAQQVKAHQPKCSASASLICEGGTASCCNWVEDELGLPEGFCIVVSEGAGSQPETGRAKPGKILPDLTSP